MNNKIAVKWTSQALGCETEKIGEIVSVIPANESAYKFLPERLYAIPKSHIKFQEVSQNERILILVKAGAKKNINHYYAPLRSVLEKQGNAETIHRFEKSQED